MTEEESACAASPKGGVHRQLPDVHPIAVLNGLVEVGNELTVRPLDGEHEVIVTGAIGGAQDERNDRWERLQVECPETLLVTSDVDRPRVHSILRIKQHPHGHGREMRRVRWQTQ
jgi:hypothetical protein